MFQLKVFDGLLKKNIMYVLGKNFNGENNIFEKFIWCNFILQRFFIEDIGWESIESRVYFVLDLQTYGFDFQYYQAFKQ